MPPPPEPDQDEDYEAYLDTICEGCGVRDTGSNFTHAGLCKVCGDKIMGMSPEELLQGDGSGGDGSGPKSVNTAGLSAKLAAISLEKTGTFQSWKDDGDEVEITLPIPEGTQKKELHVTLGAKQGRLCVIRRVPSAEEQTLLLVEPLYDEVHGGDDRWSWYLDKSSLVIALEKKFAANRWGNTLCKQGGTLEVWSGAKSA